LRVGFPLALGTARTSAAPRAPTPAPQPEPNPPMRALDRSSTRSITRTVIVAALLFAAACGRDDANVTDVAMREPVTMSVEGPTTSVTTYGDTTVAILVVDPSVSQTYSMGPHKLVIRQQGVCDLATTPYGPAYWDAPCAPSQVPVTITARSYMRNGHPHVDFSPALRFVPDSRKPSAELWIKDKQASLNGAFNILYCAELVCWDESVLDRSLSTHRDPNSGFVYRQLKHFSGYEVAAGRAGVDGDDTSYGY
jgi:hypothetical protein